MEMNSVHKGNGNEKDNLIPRYKVLKFNFSDEEKLILEELRENLIDLAISEKMSSFNEELILKDIIRFLENRLQNRFDYDYKENLARNMLKELIGYGELSALIEDDNLEEIMVIGINKPVFVYHRKYGMMETDLFFEDEGKITNIIDSIARETNRRIDQQSPILDARLSNGSMSSSGKRASRRLHRCSGISVSVPRGICFPWFSRLPTGSRMVWLLRRYASTSG